jgi:hypothetical protein
MMMMMMISKRSESNFTENYEGDEDLLRIAEAKGLRRWKDGKDEFSFR